MVEIQSIAAQVFQGMDNFLDENTSCDKIRDGNKIK